MLTREKPTREQVEGYLTERRNWGRWKENPGAGTINLITREKTVQAAGLIKKGRTVSLSRAFPVTPGPGNAKPAHHYVFESKSPTGSHFSMDYIGVAYHGLATTHIDAVCHVYQTDGVMFDGRDSKKEVLFDGAGARFGAVTEWSGGIMTRGVLLDIPKLRGVPYATVDSPVHGWELEAAAERQRVSVGPGDALVVYSGRDAFSRDRGEWGGHAEKPGLHASCLPYLRDNDISLLVWDMMDSSPNEYGLPYTVHGAIHAYGLALLDNALLEPAALACAQEGRYEFLLSVNPLNVEGGTGSPVNPIAVF